MSDRRGGGTAFLRVVLAAVVVVDLLTLYFFLGEARADALAAGTLLSAFNEFLSRPVLRGAVILAGLAGAVAFGRRPGRLWQGLLALGALTLLNTVHTQLFGSPWRHLFFSGLCLTGWLLGLAVSRYQGMPAEESYARMGSMALLGAAYLNSGISKVVYGGLTWISGLPVQSAVVAQNGLVPDGIVAAYRSWVVTMPGLASIFSSATVAFELAGPLMLVGRRTRLFVALGLFGMHANIYLLTTHILYWESMVFLLAFGLSSDPPSSESDAVTGISPRFQDRRFAAVTAVLAVFATLAIGHQARRSALLDDIVPKVVEGPPASGPPRVAAVREGNAGAVAPPLPAATVAILRQIGPFVVGQQMTDAWSIDSLDVSDDGFVITLSGEPGRIRFNVTCSHLGDSPFDVGDAHILYSQHVGFRDLEPVGRAVQEEFREAVEGHDACERVRSWRKAAQESMPG